MKLYLFFSSPNLVRGNVHTKPVIILKKESTNLSNSPLSSRSDFFFRNRGQASILAQGLATITIISIRVIRSQLRNGQSPPDLVYRRKRDSSDLRHGSRGKRPAIDSGVPAIRNI